MSSLGRSRRLVRFAQLCAVCLSTSASRAAAETTEALRLSLPDVLERASLAAPEVNVAERFVSIAKARRKGAGVILPVNPRLSIDVRPPISGGVNVRDAGYGAILDVLFEVGGAPAARVNEVAREVDVARSDLAVFRATAKLRAWDAYIEAQLAELRIAEAGVAKEIARRVFSAASRRVAAGASSDLEQASAELDLAQLEAVEKGAVRQRDLHLMSLRDALDLAPERVLSLTTPVAEPPPLREHSEYLARALQNHPELESVRSRVRLLDATQDRLEREVVPRVGFYTGVDAAPLSPIYGVVGVSIELPFAQRNQGPRAVVASQREAELTRLELQLRRLARDVRLSWSAYEARRAELGVLSRVAIPAAERSLRLAEEGWQAGRFDVFRLTTAARDAARVRSNRLDVLQAAWLELIALARAVGGDLS